MRSISYGLLAASALLLLVRDTRAQTRDILRAPVDAPAERSVQAQAIRPELQLLDLEESQNDLRIKQVAMQQAAKQDDTLKKQVELLQKQIETQQKMILLLQEQMKKRLFASYSG